MGLFSGIVKVAKFVRRERLGKKVYDALLAPGVYIPERTETKPDGTVVVVQEEVVEGQGALRSGTIRWAIAGITGSWATITFQLHNGVDIEILLAAIGTMYASCMTIYRHVRSWMPVKGMAQPVPRPPTPISQ